MPERFASRADVKKPPPWAGADRRIPFRMASVVTGGGSPIETVKQKTVLRAQAGYYIATGLWPLVHRRSFEAVSGRKADFWLAQTVGLTITAIGCGIAVGMRRGRLSPEMRATAVLAAVGLGVLEVVYVARRRISRIYLLDAVGEAAFVYALTAGDRSEEMLGSRS